MPLVADSRSDPKRSLSWIHVLVAALGVLVLFGSCVYNAKHDSVSWDESQHLYSGWLSWERGDFGYNPEVPPLLKMWDAIPLLRRTIAAPAYTGDDFKKEGFVLGQRFLAANGIDRTLIPARMMACGLTLLLAVLVFCCANEMFGADAALFALLLFCFDPNFTAHGGFVTTDVGASLTMLAAIYAFYRYVERPSASRMVIAGFAVALTMTAKFTGVFIVPLLCVIAVVDGRGLRRERKAGSATAMQMATALAAAFAIGVGWIWAIYHFRFAARPAGLALNPANDVYLRRLEPPVSRGAILTASHFHLLPEAYIYGLADTKISSGSLPSYFFGRTYAGAPHLYFPMALLIKSTLPFLLLLGMTIVFAFRRSWRRRREIAFLTIPPGFLFLLCSSSSLGIGYRHLLPILPPLYILIGGCAAFLVSERPKLAYVFGALLLWQAVTTEAARPGLLAYANEAWGGPAKTHLYLSDSNVDWGQQLKYVKQYLGGHDSQPCYFAYFGQGPVDFRDYGVRCHVLPTGSALWTGQPVMRFGDNPFVSGTLLISDGVVAGADIPGKRNPYARFAAVKPVAVVDRGVYVYQGRFDLSKAAALEYVHAAEEAAAQHDDDLARRDADAAIQLDGDDPEAHAILGDMLAARGNTVAATREYGAALASPELDRTFQKELITQLRLKVKH